MADKIISFLRGVPADEVLQKIGGYIPALMAKVLEEFGIATLQYATPGLADFNGFHPLKKVLAEKYGVNNNPNERVICGNGGMEIITFLLRSLSPGVILTEEVTYDRFIEQVRICGHKPLGVEFNGSGLNIGQIEKFIKDHQVIALYQVVYHQNPSGRSTTAEDVREIARICSKNGVLYIVDIAYEELRYDGRENFKINLNHIDHRLTCLIGSFTKTFTAGAKCGYGILPRGVVQKLTPLIANSRLNPNYLTQALIHEAMRNSYYKCLLKKTCRFYGERMDEFNQAIGEFLPHAWTDVLTGGFFNFLRLPGVSDPRALTLAAKKRGVMIDAGTAGIPPNLLHKYYGQAPVRLTFPAVPNGDIYEGVEKLRAAWAEVRS